MAELAPIKGLLFDPTRVDVARVIAPPYDVISEAERVSLEALDPHNSVRLILPRGEGDDRYAHAAATLGAWKQEGILKRDTQPAIYRYHQIYTSAELGPLPVTRKGFIAAVRLHRFDEGVILPHERTLRGPKEDRLKLMRATKAHFSQIFTLYPDPDRETDRAFEAAEAQAPYLEGATADGTLHRLWRVSDAHTLSTVTRALAEKKLYIADGHHRYETMLALRDEFRSAAGGSVPPSVATEFGTLFLANMDDPGLVVLPTHRLVHSLASFDRASLLTRLAAAFEVSELAGGASDAVALRAALAERSSKRPTFAVVTPGESRAWLLSLKIAPESTGLPGAPALVCLDVSLLHGLVLEGILGIDRRAQESQTNLSYVKDTKDALARVARGDCQVGFIMHATRVDQVRAVADCAEVMPQKSTFFYPKIASGLVINPLDPAEHLG
jgi:uncharacterized protein (DUF1015 family)